jgi:hypothetical protein
MLNFSGPGIDVKLKERKKELQVAHKLKSFGLPNVQILFTTAKTFFSKNHLFSQI